MNRYLEVDLCSKLHTFTRSSSYVFEWVSRIHHNTRTKLSISSIPSLYVHRVHLQPQFPKSMTLFSTTQCPLSRQPRPFVPRTNEPTNIHSNRRASSQETRSNRWHRITKEKSRHGILATPCSFNLRTTYPAMPNTPTHNSRSTKRVLIAL